MIIPIYKEKISYLEQISLKRIHEILSEYHIIYIEPETLNYSDGHQSKVERFADFYFESIKTYNRLLLNPDFYRRFIDYRYILICQLDVFIFSDRLMEFCRLGYDYYGAPWLNGTPLNVGRGTRIRFAGNGGLSLRNVEKTIALLEESAQEAKSYQANEDFFFSYYASKNYIVAPTDVCKRFCIETQVRRCMKMNRGDLPFGTHAWERYDYVFWKPYIESFGYDLSDVNCTGNEDTMNKKGMLRNISAFVLRNISDTTARNWHHRYAVKR